MKCLLILLFLGLFDAKTQEYDETELSQRLMEFMEELESEVYPMPNTADERIRQDVYPMPNVDPNTGERILQDTRGQLGIANVYPMPNVEIPSKLYCSVLPDSPVAGNTEKGCPGANGNQRVTEHICRNDGGVTYAWYAQCCRIKEIRYKPNPFMVAIKKTCVSKTDKFHEECWSAFGCNDNGRNICAACGNHGGQAQYCCGTGTGGKKRIYPKGHNCHNANFDQFNGNHRCVTPAKSQECSSKCDTCKSGGGAGGEAVVNGVCHHWCSTESYCGTSSAYKRGTDCSACVVRDAAAKIMKDAQNALARLGGM